MTRRVRWTTHYTLSSTQDRAAATLEAVSSSPRLSQASVPVSAQLFTRAAEVILVA